MKRNSILSALFLGGCLPSLSGQTLLYSDHFDTGATERIALDSSDTTSRFGGTLATEAGVALQSYGALQFIDNDQLDLVQGGGVRFGPETNRFNWASGATGAAILADGGFKVTFDWIHTGEDSEWIAWKVGTPNSDSGVNAGEVDHAVLIRQGATGSNQYNERWDNGSNSGYSGISHNPDVGNLKTYSVTLTYTFDSFDDGSTVNLRAVVDGILIVNDLFTWDNNGGALHMEMASGTANNLVDNLAVSTLDGLVFDTTLEGTAFISGDPVGTPIGYLEAALGVNPVNSNFTFVTGEGDTDNGRFAIDGDELQVGSDFTGVNSVDSQEFSIRVLATSSEGGGESSERSFTLTVSKDDDLDELPDEWELRWAPDLQTLDGLSFSADADSDTLLDSEEYQLSLGGFLGYPAYPDIDPTDPDTDGDGVLSDGDELFPTEGFRVPTNPTLLDTDYDGLSDVAETNTGTYVDANDTGTDPTDQDTDDDGSRDGWELANLGQAAIFDASQFPPSLSNKVTVNQFTDLASSGISSSKSYTHKISGGGPATIDGVAFDVLTSEAAIPNFTWEAPVYNEFTNSEFNSWVPANGGVSAQGLLELLGTFVYSSGDPGAEQTFTLSGLTPGEDYLLKIYVRTWDYSGGADDTGRPVDLTFTNGSEVEIPYGAIALDRPGIVLGTANNDDAYYLTYAYTAQGTEVVVKAGVNPGARTNSGSLHLYGLTNELDGVVLQDLSITDSNLDSAGNFTLSFSGSPATTYQVTKSADLSSGFEPLESPLSPTTDGNGEGQVTVPVAEFNGEARYFLRIEQ
ncbi:hypothetical protein AAFN60_14630 [Roseibacillus persicicus]|uniref:hypothetical protein n=1 Tax=Roseibacillus persicicus TaxID=454148 RepID=UPI00398BB046